MTETHIVFARPCHEDWAMMRPEARARWCESRRKPVHDLSLHTDYVDSFPNISSSPTLLAVRDFGPGWGSTGHVRRLARKRKLVNCHRNCGPSQLAFAARFGFSPAAVKDWEQNRRRPEASARVLLTVINHDPDAVIRALEAS